MSKESSLSHYQANAKREVWVKDTQQLIDAIQDLEPGDLVVLRDGTYSGDAVLNITGKQGTLQLPMVIVAEHQGQALLTGTLHFEVVQSSYLTIAGLVFNNKGSGSKGDMGAIHLKHTHHTRLTRNHFELVEEYGANPTAMLDWVAIRGRQSQYNRVDHNLFQNKLQRGRFLIIGVLAEDDSMPQHTRVDHNYFHYMAPIGKNGMEAVVIGGGHPRSAHFIPDTDAHTLFEYNLMEQVDGECAEIISFKSSGNIVRYNTIVNTTGSVYFRAGQRNTVEGNYFLGQHRVGSGGVRLYGSDHRVVNNYFSQLDLPAVMLGDGNADHLDPDTNIGPFMQVQRAIVAFNTFVNTRVGLARHFRDNCVFTAQDTVIANNLIATQEICAPIDPHLLELPGVQWCGNMLYAPNSALPEQLVDYHKSPNEITVANPKLVPSGLYPDYVYSIAADSPAVNAAIAPFHGVSTDIAGQLRDAQPDVGAFEQLGSRPLRGRLYPRDVGPDAYQDLAAEATQDKGPSRVLDS